MRAPISLSLLIVSIIANVALAGMDERTLRASPHWMPAQTTVTKPVEFQSGLKVTPKDTVDVAGWEPEGVLLRKGTAEFVLPVNQTKLLTDADAYKAKFTPEQQKLTTRDLQQRKELWPYFVKMKETVRFQDRTAFEAGKQYPLWSVEGDGPHVYFERKGQTYTIEPEAMDFYASCLAGLIKPPSRLFDEVRANAIRADTGKPAELPADGGPQYLALYHAGAWCPHCETSTPDVVKWYDELKASGGDKTIELVLLSADKSPAEFKKHIADKKMTFLAIPPERNAHTFVLNKMFPQRPTPWLYLVDRQGKTIVDGDADGTAKERTLAVIEKIKAVKPPDTAKTSADAGAPKN